MDVNRLISPLSEQKKTTSCVSWLNKVFYVVCILSFREVSLVILLFFTIIN